jgi:hypothetical protein
VLELQIARVMRGGPEHSSLLRAEHGLAQFRLAALSFVGVLRPRAL